MSTAFKSILKTDKAQSPIEQALSLQDQAAAVGFDWPNIHAVFEKVHEELDELKAAIMTNQGIVEEYGDLLFVLINIARHLSISPNEAINNTNCKFKKRFEHIENYCKQQNLNLSDLSLDKMEALWQDAKQFD